MKMTLLILCFLTARLAHGAATPDGSNSLPATITGVSAAEDGRSLVIRYERSGRAHAQRLAFTNDISDFRYCRWLGDRGIAVVASTSTHQFFYATVYLNGQNESVSPVMIPAPDGKSRLLGIANTGGDSIVITAVEHHRSGNDAERLSGWMFIDNCPPIGPKVGLITRYDIPVEPSGTTKR